MGVLLALAVLVAMGRGFWAGGSLSFCLETLVGVFSVFESLGRGFWSEEGPDFLACSTGDFTFSVPSYFFPLESMSSLA